jgi:hypothetical protein
VAGNGKVGTSGDGGAAKAATLNYPEQAYVEPNGNVLIADRCTVRRYIAKEGRVVRVAGTDSQGNAGLNGLPEWAQLRKPVGITVGPSGAIYIADTDNDRILKIDSDPGVKLPALLAG